MLLRFYTVVCEPILRQWSLCIPTENILRSNFLMFSGSIERDMWHKVGLRTLKSTRTQMFFRIGVLKNVSMFEGKYLSWSVFLIKLQVSSPVALLFEKKLPLRYFPLNIAKSLRAAFFYRTLRFWTLSHIYDQTFFAQIINYLSVNYFGDILNTRFF